MLEIFVAPLNHLEPDDIKWKEHVSLQRWEDSRRLKSRAARARSVGAELLLNHALKQFLPKQKFPIHYRRDESGKPFLMEGNLHFNLSHSGELAACVISGVPAGIDIQEMRPVKWKAMQRFFAPEEIQALQQQPEEKRAGAILHYWVLKESYAKMTGEGLAGLRSRCSLQITEESIRMLRQGQLEKARFSLWPEIHPGYAMAVCTAGECFPRPVVHLPPPEWLF